MVYLLKMVIFHGYVSSPEGSYIYHKLAPSCRFFNGRLFRSSRGHPVRCSHPISQAAASQGPARHRIRHADVHRFREGPETPQKSMGLEMKSHLWAHRMGGLNIEFVIIVNHGWKPPWKPWSNMCLCHFLTTVGQSYKDTAYPLICRPRLEAAADSSSVLDR